MAFDRESLPDEAIPSTVIALNSRGEEQQVGIAGMAGQMWHGWRDPLADTLESLGIDTAEIDNHPTILRMPGYLSILHSLYYLVRQLNADRFETLRQKTNEEINEFVCRKSTELTALAQKLGIEYPEKKENTGVRKLYDYGSK